MLLLQSIRYNLAWIASFSGRESRALFWPYAIFLFVLSMIAGVLAWVPALFDMLGRMERYLAEHPEGLPTQPGPYPGARLLPPELMPDVSATMLPMAIVNGVLVVLLAAAIVRRLHDRDKSGWWAALPLPFMIFGQVEGSKAATMMMGGAQPDPAVMLPAALNSLFYWAAFIALVVLLAQEGDVGPNRYGPEIDGTD